MKIRYYLTLSVLLISLTSFSQKGKTSLEFMKLKGQVKSIKSTKYRALLAFGEVIKGEEISNELWPENSFRQFDKTGFMIEHILLFTEGKVHSKTVYKYNWKTYETWITRYTDSDTSESRSVKYFKKDRVVKFYVYKDTSRHVRTTSYDYDKKGNMIKYEIFNLSDSTSRRFEYVFSEKGQLIEQKGYDYDNDLMLWLKFETNKYGDPVKEVKYKEEGDIVYKKTFAYTYDEENNWTRKIELKKGKPTEIIERKISYY